MDVFLSTVIRVPVGREFIYDPDCFEKKLCINDDNPRSATVVLAHIVQEGTSLREALVKVIRAPRRQFLVRLSECNLTPLVMVILMS